MVVIEMCDGESVSTCDDNFKDIITGNIYESNWSIIGTASHTNIDECENFEHFKMMYVDNMVYENADIGSMSMISISDEVETVEVMPVTKSLLGDYYEYFRNKVIQDKTDMLINICRQSIKSPCFDIKDCRLVEAVKGIDNPDCIVITFDDDHYIPLIPSSVITRIESALGYIDIKIDPDNDDYHAYNRKRIRTSGLCTFTNVRKLKWDRSKSVNDFNSIVKCTAVTTATFTVSIVLSKYKEYSMTKALTVVIHAIK